MTNLHPHHQPNSKSHPIHTWTPKIKWDCRPVNHAQTLPNPPQYPKLSKCPTTNHKTPCHQWRGRWHKQWPKSSHNWAPHSPKLVQQWWRWQWPLIFIIIVGLTSPLQEDDRGHSGQYVQSDQGQQTRWKVEIKNKKLFFFFISFR